MKSIASRTKLTTLLALILVPLWLIAPAYADEDAESEQSEEQSDEPSDEGPAEPGMVIEVTVALQPSSEEQLSQEPEDAAEAPAEEAVPPVVDSEQLPMA